tara:strand:+ start:6827 stop:7474 length:648 start_codon:yes stop_codon:yes gene_type:complete
MKEMKNNIKLTKKILENKLIFQSILKYCGLKFIIILLKNNYLLFGIKVILRMNGIVTHRSRKSVDKKYILCIIEIKGDNSSITLDSNEHCVDSYGYVDYNKESYKLTILSYNDNSSLLFSPILSNIEFLNSEKGICWRDRVKMETNYEILDKKYKFTNIGFLRKMIEIFEKIKDYKSKEWIFSSYNIKDNDYNGIDDYFYENIFNKNLERSQESE